MFYCDTKTATDSAIQPVKTWEQLMIDSFS